MARTYSAGRRAGAGIFAGAIAGIVMALVAMVRAQVLGLGFWLPMKLVAALFWGVEALIGGSGVIIVGIVIHLVVAGFAGMLFGLVLGNRLTTSGALVLGVIYGMAIWAFNTWAVLPVLNQVMLDRQMIAPGWWFIYHLIYGALLLLMPGFAQFMGPPESGRRAMAA